MTKKKKISGSTDVVKKIWGFCNYLKHEGMNYGLYIEQITYLMFLKMSHEKGIKLPTGCNWDELINFSGTKLLEKYSTLLEKLGKEKGTLGSIFFGSSSAFKKNAANLKQLLNDLNNIEWSIIDIDVKARIYEGLLAKYASSEKGAGQYFTPRPLIRSIIRCVKPDFTKHSDYTIHDPASGTCGFLIGAFEWIMKKTDDGSKLSIPDRKRLIKNTFSGGDIEENTRRIGLMNCFLHELEPKIYLDSSLGEGYANKQYDLVITNPPFGTSGVGGRSNRDDFLVTTSNKQLNFIQHIFTILKPHGHCAMVVPDSVVTGSELDNDGREIRKNLLESCNLHTILRVPNGAFIPYANQPTHVLFFTKGSPTKDTWIYDLRTNKPNVRIRKPLTEEHFIDFEKCYDQNPRKANDRFKKFPIQKIIDAKYDLGFQFIKDKSEITLDDIPEPKVLVKDISINLKHTMDSFNEFMSDLKMK